MQKLLRSQESKIFHFLWIFVFLTSRKCNMRSMSLESQEGLMKIPFVNIVFLKQIKRCFLNQKRKEKRKKKKEKINQ